MADHPMSKNPKKSLRLKKLVPQIADDDLAAVAGGVSNTCAYTICCSLANNKNVTRRAPRRR
jgi:hypothetical protein